MGETFYAVQQLINGIYGITPSKFSSLDEAREFINRLNRYLDDLGPTNISVEYHVYEVKEITY